MPLIKDGRLVDDPWVQVSDSTELPADGPLLVSYDIWRDNRDILAERDAPIGVRLDPGQSPAAIVDHLDRFDLIALPFAKFTDGRAYSHARLLRERHGFTGELRAVGQVLRDQFLFMHRCGFDAFEVADGEAASGWSQTLSEIGVVYQPTGDRRRRRCVNPGPATGGPMRRSAPPTGLIEISKAGVACRPGSV